MGEEKSHPRFAFASEEGGGWWLVVGGGREAQTTVNRRLDPFLGSAALRWYASTNVGVAHSLLINNKC